MGLFDFLKKDKTDENMVKLTDFFSEEDIKEVKDLLSHNRMGVHYRTVNHQTAAKTMIGYMSNPNKTYNPNKMGAFVNTAETIMVMEPSLKPILEKGIARIQGKETEYSRDQISGADQKEEQDKASDLTPDYASKEPLDNTPEKIPDNISEEAPDNISEEAPDNISEETGREDLMKAIEQSDLSYEEVMALLKEKKQS